MNWPTPNRLHRKQPPLLISEIPHCKHRGAVVLLTQLSCCDAIETRECAIHGTCINTIDDWNHVRGLMAREGYTCHDKCCELCPDLAYH